MNIREWNPGDGMAFQGDVSIIPIPADIALATNDEIAPINGRLIIQEGELTGHHHAIRVRNFRTDTRHIGDPALVTKNRKLAKAFAGKIDVAVARLYRDALVPQEMVRRGILTRADLATGVLVVEGESVALSHEEHDAISIPVGRYLIGRQVESAGAEERRVED